MHASRLEAVSGARGLRDLEAVLEHLVARHDIACDRQDDRELRRDDLAGRLDSGLKRSDDRGAAVARENVLDLKADGLGQRVDIADEIGDRLAADLAADPGPHPLRRPREVCVPADSRYCPTSAVLPCLRSDLRLATIGEELGAGDETRVI